MHDILHRLHAESISYEMQDPGDGETIRADRQSAIVPIKTGASGETRTVHPPLYPGQELTLQLKTDGGGDAVVTVTGGYNQADSTSITLGDEGDFVQLYAVNVDGTYKWRVRSQEGTGLTQTDITATTATLTTAAITTATISALNYTTAEKTATADGTGTGTIADSGMVQFVKVTSDSADKIVVLPTPTPGTIVLLHVGANGFELRTSAPATIAINGGSGANAESAIPANTLVFMVCTSATTWQGWDLTGTTFAAVEAAVA